MKTTLKVEEGIMLLFSIYLFNSLDFNWWWYLVLFLTPDVSFLGYKINKIVGAYLYNLFHHKGLALIIYIIGVSLKNEYLQLIGIILFGHSSFDRILGYGLKYTDSFNNTHLGKIGNDK